MRIAVTGGSGFAGNHLVEKLVLEGHKLKVLVRKTSNTKLLKEQGVELVDGDVRDKKSIEKLVNDADIVYHLAAQFHARSKFELWNVNFHGTENMLEACLNKDLTRFVHVSTIGVTGNIVNPPGNESDSYNPTTHYDLSKCEAEKIVLRYHREYGMPVTVVRPTVLTGPSALHLRLYKGIKSGYFPLIGNMTNLMHPCYIENFLQGITLAAEKRKAIGEIYIIADEKPITWIEFVETIAEVMGVNPPNIRVPISLMKVIAYLFEFKSWMFGGEPFLSKWWIDEVTKTFAYDVAKAKRDLGYNPEISLKEGISRTIDWYRKNGFFK